jgi:hypothetical protein
MMPAPTRVVVVSCEATRATNSPSPAARWNRKWSLSIPPEAALVTVPPPITLAVDPLNPAAPGATFDPTSTLAHPSGSGVADGVAARIVGADTLSVSALVATTR